MFKHSDQAVGGSTNGACEERREEQSLLRWSYPGQQDAIINFFIINIIVGIRNKFMVM